MHNLEQAARQALEALRNLHESCQSNGEKINVADEICLLRAALEQPAEEPVNLPPPEFEWAADGIEIGHDMFGGVDIRLDGEFVYVHINYDYRYTDNATRQRLAEQIVGILTGSQPTSEWVGLTDEEVVQCQQGDVYHFYRCIEAKLKEKNA
jgi:hypothetical protein